MNKKDWQNNMWAALVGILAVVFLTFLWVDSPAVEGTHVRIAILRGVNDVKVRIQGPFSLLDRFRRKKFAGAGN